MQILISLSDAEIKEVREKTDLEFEHEQGQKRLIQKQDDEECSSSHSHRRLPQTRKKRT